MPESQKMATPRARRSARRQNAVIQSAERQMADHRFDVIRTPGRRRTLAALLIVLIASTCGLFWIDQPIAATLTLIVGIALWLLLRVAVRTMADLPVELLDERQAQVRGEAYVESYRWFAGLALVVLAGVMIAFILSGSDPNQLTISITLNQIQAVFWGVNGLALSLPSLVIAFREPSI